MDVRLVESLRGVDSKYNEQGSGSLLQLNSDYSLCKPPNRTPKLLWQMSNQFDLIFTLNNNNITTHLKITRSRYFCTFFMTKSEV